MFNRENAIVHKSATDFFFRHRIVDKAIFNIFFCFWQIHR